MSFFNYFVGDWYVIMQPTLFVSQPIIDTIVKECCSNYPYEACGFLIGNNGFLKTVFDSKSSKNQSNDLNRYSIDPFDFYKTEKSLDKSNLSITGFYHSHPNGSPHPSRYDIKDAWIGYSYVIISVDAHQSIAIKSWLIDATTGTCDGETICIV